MSEVDSEFKKLAMKEKAEEKEEILEEKEIH